MQRACLGIGLPLLRVLPSSLPLHMKYSPIAQPVYGAMYCMGAGSELAAFTTMV